MMYVRMQRGKIIGTVLSRHVGYDRRAHDTGIHLRMCEQFLQLYLSV